MSGNTVTFSAKEAERLGWLLASDEGQSLAGVHYQTEPMQRLAAALSTGARIVVKSKTGT